MCDYICPDCGVALNFVQGVHPNYNDRFECPSCGCSTEYPIADLCAPYGIDYEMLLHYGFREYENNDFAGVLRMYSPTGGIELVHEHDDLWSLSFDYPGGCVLNVDCYINENGVFIPFVYGM